MHHYSAFVRAQQDALIREFFANPANCYIGVPSLDALAKRDLSPANTMTSASTFGGFHC